MPIDFREIPVRIVSKAIQKSTRKNSIYLVTIVEAVGGKSPDHWYANAYPNTHTAASSLFGHVHPLVQGNVGEEVFITGQVRKYTRNDCINVVLDVSIAYASPDC